MTEAGKVRNPFVVWIVLPIVTLGIYYFVWWYKINREARDFAVPETRPGVSLLAELLGWILIVPWFWSIYTTGSRIGLMQRKAGVPETCNPVIGLALGILSFFNLHSLYYQFELNKVWRAVLPEQAAA